MPEVEEAERPPFQANHLMLRTVRFPEQYGTSQNDMIMEKEIAFSPPLANTKNGFTVEAVLKGFSLEYGIDGRRGEYALGKEEVRAEITDVRADSATVRVIARLRPRDAGNAFTFWATAQVLVIAAVATASS
ncbi:hypothetical protein IHE55_09215 [Streptomyces pactum]|uniref:Uncharacterized protein n=1 Tax=Streptomyces pactum TaxID=68249 RepID=A0ABS0NID7_9ACTN|nr:hypothetical protein [Streptomyces pactum]MBH5334963.1 hypothetical protein [Streptomyces pactum]